MQSTYAETPRAGRLPEVDDLHTLTPKELREIMPVWDARDPRAEIEMRLLKIFAWASMNHASDIHFVGRHERAKPEVTLSIRTKKGLINEIYRDEYGKAFETKIFQLTGQPMGGSSPAFFSGRFDMRFPASYVRRYGLYPKEGSNSYDVSVRVEYARTFDGFGIVCRLLDQQKTPQLHDMGFTGAFMRELMNTIQQPQGLVIISGPTGSGKTTLLNAILNYLNDGTVAISTAEDPIEYPLTRHSVKQIHATGEVTFPRALRSILRQDPDIILIGEIRDPETMEIALQSSQTGHLVFATLHANSSYETVGRALDLCQNRRVDAVRLAESLLFVGAQRLLPRYEGEMIPRELTRGEREWLSLNGIPCPGEFREIASTTKMGRAPVIEGISITDEIKKVIYKGDFNNEEIYRLARNQLQYESLASAGVRGIVDKGFRLKDCMGMLNTNTDAKEYPGWRLMLARDMGCGLSEISTTIDEATGEWEKGIGGAIKDEVLHKLRQKKRDSATRLQGEMAAA